MLIVEDDAGLRRSLEKFFRQDGYTVVVAERADQAMRLLHENLIDLMLLDIHLPDRSGLSVLAETCELDPRILTIVMTAYADIQTAVRAMQGGAHDFVVKPFELDELHLIVERAVEARHLRRQVRRFERERISGEPVQELLGQSPVMRQLRDQIDKVAVAQSPVLVVGETGTGKELVVNTIHRRSRRVAGPLVKVNCSAVSEHLLESELFGHEKGAFTDAREPREGLFEMADGGTLFLDEISEMKLDLQAKFLRVIEGHPFRRVGGRREIRVDVRVVAATNRTVPDLIRQKQFREDLYYRLNAFQIAVPPLRQRGHDIALLGRHLLGHSASALRKGPLTLSDEAEKLLLSYHWPGNVRELSNVMEHAAILCETAEVGPEHLPSELHVAATVRPFVSQPGALPTLQEVERHYIAHVVHRVGGNVSEAARILGIARNTLRAKLRES